MTINRRIQNLQRAIARDNRRNRNRPTIQQHLDLLFNDPPIRNPIPVTRHRIRQLRRNQGQPSAIMLRGARGAAARRRLAIQAYADVMRRFNNSRQYGLRFTN